ncbi:MAG: PSD1 and planctomycete cytochrome C domain-containing protein [Bacteroidota bacterium]
MSFRTTCYWFLLLLLGSTSYSCIQSEVSYSQDIKPILNKNCISCHGGVKSSGGFNLLTRELALSPTDAGEPAIIPGNAGESEFIKRLITEDEDERMPYEHDPLPTEEINILKKWVDQGVQWEKHWAYQSLAPPQTEDLNKYGGENYIDFYIRRKLSKADLKPAEKANDKILFRRLSLDIVGYVDIDLWESYSRGSIPTYEALVDSLLSMPQFGEKWASMWLDLARYADSKGYERDPHREIWRYRDWVIQALNDDKPYDTFITEQLAGDLLPNPTEDQLIATGFHRNTQTNDEGGTNSEEFRTTAVLDRVNTTYEGLMSTTMACVQCHSHPYDPVFHDEFYQSVAYFNNSVDVDDWFEYPYLRMFSEEQEDQWAKLENSLKAELPDEEVKRLKDFLYTYHPVGYGITTQKMENAFRADNHFLTLRRGGLAQIPDVLAHEGDNTLTLKMGPQGNNPGKLAIRLDDENGPTLATIYLNRRKNQPTLFQLPIRQQVEAGKHELYVVHLSPQTSEETVAGIDWIGFQQMPKNKNLQTTYQDLLNASTGKTLIMRERPEEIQRTTQVFDRGNWLVKMDTVHPSVPSELQFMDQQPADRLELANWMTHKDHPLTSRTIVNRLWEQIFGIGIVETVEDMGSQGEPPTHPELLDALAWRMIHENDWSLKQTLKTIFLSATYQQKSEIGKEAFEKDPRNQLYGRGPRVRLSAEQIRDNTLATAGLLSSKMYGPSVMPYQPEGIWVAPYSSMKWKMSEGEDRYRRAVYTYIRRSNPYPAFMTFDATDREVCTSRRVRTNTPLQALVTLNDASYLEAAKAFAMRMEQAEGGVREKIMYGLELMMVENMNEKQLTILENLYQASLTEMAEGTSPRVLLIGHTEEPEALNALEVVANAMLNLDVFLMKN